MPLEQPISLVDRIGAILPQTQCTQCGFEGCRPYAEAIASHQAEINRCPPGGLAGVEKLAKVTARAIIPFDESCGDPEAPLVVARILEQHCIGCTLCIQACPVDAIAGANKRMHTILVDSCTGCGLCLPPCPVDCIVLEPANRLWSELDAQQAKIHFDRRKERLHRLQTEPDHAFAEQSVIKRNGQLLADIGNAEDKSDRIQAALARARARRQSTQ